MLNDLAAIYSANVALFAASVFVLGLVVGSFLNVVIYRLPIMLEREWRAQAAEFSSSIDDTAAAATWVEGVAEPITLSTPRSACPACKAPTKPGQTAPGPTW